MKLKKPFTITLLGISGSGKGTQAEMVIPRLRPIRYIQTGKMLRRLAEGKNAAAGLARGIIGRGDLVPNWLSSHMWSDDIIKNLSPKDNILIDGSPRTKEEAILLDKVIAWLKRPLPRAVYIYLSPKEAERRLLKRKRKDDTPYAIKGRIRFFNKDVVPVLNFYRRRGRLMKVNGEQSVEGVFKDIKRVLGIK